MANEEAIKQELESKFSFTGSGLRVQRERRIFADIALENFHPCFEHLVKGMGFSMFSAMTAADEGETISLIYHIARPDGTLINLKTYLPKAAPKINSISARFPTALIYEREMVDLLGVDVLGMPADANRYPLPDDWPKGVYPLRKDFDPSVLDKMDGKETK